MCSFFKSGKIFEKKWKGLIYLDRNYNFKIFNDLIVHLSGINILASF